MKQNFRKQKLSRARLGAVAVLMAALCFAIALSRSHARPGAVALVSTDKLEHFLRERYAIPMVTKIAIEPLHDSSFPGFTETQVVMDDGKAKKNQTVYVTKDGRYLALGTLVTLGNDPGTEIVQKIRATFKVPETTVLKAGPLEKSKFVEFQQMKIATPDGKGQDFFVNHDHVAVLGEVMLLEMNLRAKPLRTMVLRDQPSVGPASAPVTIVEYADLQCPMCAKFHDFLESELLPHYGDKVRLVFKEFPLPIHDWSMTAAIADQCTYQISPSNFLPYRSMIFKHQDGFSAANVRTALLQYSDEIGIDHDKLAACIDSKESMPRIEENKREGDAIGVNSTPTTFINGRIVVGVPAPEEYFALVDEALRSPK